MSTLPQGGLDHRRYLGWFGGVLLLLLLLVFGDS